MPVQLNMFVDTSHASDVITHRSCTGIIIFLNGAPIHWYSKHQLTIETSTFGLEFVALKIGTKLLEGIQYKLRTFGVPLDGPANTFCDIMSVCNNVTNPTSTLTKCHNLIAYHKSRKFVAAGTQCIAHKPATSNIADMLTKALPQNLFHKAIRHTMTS